MAEDSKEKTQQEPQKPAGTTSLVVVRKDGTKRELLKGADGKFARKANTMYPTSEFIRQRRKRMLKVNENGLTEDMWVVEELLDIIHTPIGTDKKSGLLDAKFASVKVKAAETLWLFTGGKPDPSEREMDKLERQAVVGYFIQTPPNVNPELVDGDKPVDKPTQPTFAEVTNVTTNPKK
jgi:hypothetical protein